MASRILTGKKQRFIVGVKQTYENNPIFTPHANGRSPSAFLERRHVREIHPCRVGLYGPDRSGRRSSQGRGCAVREARATIWERLWTRDDIECGDCTQRPDDWNLTFSVKELARFLRGWQPSQSHLHKCKDLSQVWFSRTEEDFRTGGQTEESMHLRHEATPREKRIWAWAIRAALKRGWIR